MASSYAHLPLSFEPNQGQTRRPVKFLSRGAGYTLFLTGGETVLELSKKALPQTKLPGGHFPSPQGALTQPSGRVASAVLRTRLLNASSQPSLSGEDELPGKSNYLIGKDPARWRTNIPNYGKVRYRGVYPGIDLVYYGNQRQLEYDFVVSPGASPEKIALEISGARSARVAPVGDLALETPSGVVTWHKPTVYQLIGGRRQPVACRYSLD
ncbi:MAG: hypothetical protein LC772_05570, partial [Chloroflexi bacterium]|nr:hypothetical protein [Chloroflexota bacterium]